MNVIIGSTYANRYAITVSYDPHHISIEFFSIFFFNAVLKVQHINIQCLRTCCTFSTARKNIWEPRVKTLGYINARLSA